MTHIKFVTGLIVAATAFLTQPARASVVTFTLDQDGCTGTCGTGPFATVTITDHGVGTAAYVSVLQTLATNILFADTGAGVALAFNVNSPPGPITISNLTAGFHVGPAPISASTFGSFSYSIECNSKVPKDDPQPLPITCQGGNPTNIGGPLSFDVSSALGITTADFIANVGGYFFASDVIGNNRNTGNVAAMGGVVTVDCGNAEIDACATEVSEPTSLSLVIFSALAFAGLGFMSRKRAFD